MKNLHQYNKMKINFEKLIKEIKQNKMFWVSILLMIISIFLYCIKIPDREIYVLGSFIFLVIVVIFKFIK